MFVSVDWFYLHTIFALLSGVSFVIFFFLPESPKYLVQTEEFDRALEAYNCIAIFNGTPNLQLSRAVNHRFWEERSSDRRMLKTHMKKSKVEKEKKTITGIAGNLAASIIDEDERENASSSYSKSDRIGWSNRRKDSATYMLKSAERKHDDNSIEYLMV